MRKHDGSIFSFIAIAMVLVIATGLVVFAINNRTVSDSEVVDDAISRVDDKSDKDQSSDKGDSAKGEDTSSGVDKSQNGDIREGEDESDSSIGDSPGTSSPEPGPSSSGSSSQPQSEVPTSNEVGSDKLPETGLTQDLLSSAIGILAIVGAGYIYYHFGRN